MSQYKITVVGNERTNPMEPITEYMGDVYPNKGEWIQLDDASYSVVCVTHVVTNKITDEPGKGNFLAVVIEVDGPALWPSPHYAL